MTGARLYAANCVTCHQADGKGLPKHFPPLVGSEFVSGADPGPLVRLVLSGKRGGRVGGGGYPIAMPAFRGQLTDGELAALVTHVRQTYGGRKQAVEAGAISRLSRPSAE